VSNLTHPGGIESPRLRFQQYISKGRGVQRVVTPKYRLHEAKISRQSDHSAPALSVLALWPAKALIKPLQALNIHLANTPYHTTNQSTIRRLEKRHNKKEFVHTIIDDGLRSC
jgi:hypothetical protein